MAKLYDRQTGQGQDFSEADAAAALQSGQFVPHPDLPLSMLDPETGKVVDVQPEDAAKAVGAGFKLLDNKGADAARDAEIYGDSAVAKASTAGLGYLRTFTGGLSDLAAEKSGLFTGHDLEQLAEQNPKSSIAGRAAGFIPSFLAPMAEGAAAHPLLTALAGGAPGLTGRLGEEVGGLGALAGLGNTGQAFVRGAAEAVPFTVSDNLTEDVFQNKELTAESLLAHVGPSALLGGALSVGFEKALGLAKQYLPAGFDKTSKALNRLEEDFTPPKPPEAIPGVAIPEAPAPVAGLPAREAPTAFAPKADVDVEGAQRKFRDTLAQAYQGIQDHLGDFRKEVKPQVITQMLGESDRAAPVADGLVKQLQDGLEKARISGVASDELQREIEGLSTKLAAASNDAERFMALDGFKSKADRFLKFSRADGAQIVLSPEQAAAIQPLRDSVGRVRSTLESAEVWGKDAAGFQAKTNAGISSYLDSLDGMRKAGLLRKAVGDEEGRFAVDAKGVSRFVKGVAKGDPAYDDATKFFASHTQAGKDLLQSFQDEAYSRLSTRPTATKDIIDLIEQAQSGSRGASDAINQQAEVELGNKLGQRTADRAQRIYERQVAADLKTQNAAQRASQKAYDQAVSAAEKESGQLYRGQLRGYRQAAREFEKGGMVGHALDRVPVVGDALKYMRKAGVFAKVFGASADITQKLSASVRTALQGVEGKAAGELLSAESPRIAKWLDSDLLAQHVSSLSGTAANYADTTKSLQQHTPQMATILTSKHADIAAALQQAQPKNPVPPSGLPGDPKWKPSKTEQRAYEAKVRVAEQPFSIFADFAKGTMTTEQVKTFAQFYPEIYKAAVMELDRALTETTKPIPYKQRLMISTFKQAPVGFAQQVVSPMVQQMGAMAPPPEQQPAQGRALGAATRPSKAGMGRLHLDTQSQTSLEAATDKR